MLPTRRLLYPRRFYAEMDYAMHMPKAYVDRMKRNVPKKVYDNRFGTPPVIRWAVPPGDYNPLKTMMADDMEIKQAKRPWEGQAVHETLRREQEYQQKLYANKFFRAGRKNIPAIPAEQWTIFPGDLVQVMIGRDKGNQGIVSHVIRDENAVFVEGMHQKLQQNIPDNIAKNYEVKPYLVAFEQPLYVHKGQVKLVDPNDGDSCTAQWVLNDSKTGYIRVSTRTGFEIPLPSTSFRTYEYTSPETYIEVKEKDTPADIVLHKSYMPKLSTFEQEIEEEMGLEKLPENPDKPPTYWY